MWPITKSALVAFVTVTPSDATVDNTERNIKGSVCSIQTTVSGCSDGVFLIIHT